MNPEIFQRLKQFEREGFALQSWVNKMLSQTYTQQSLGNMAAKMIVGELFPYGIKEIGNKMAKNVLAYQSKAAKTDVSFAADRWLNSITTFLNHISIVTFNVTEKGNSKNIIRKFNHAKKGVKAETKINRGLKALNELLTYDLVYNHDLKNIIGERKLRSIQVKELKKLLNNHPSVLESVLGAIERIEKGGFDANRQCLSSCRNAIENLVKEISGENDWRKGLKIIVQSKTRQNTVKNTHRFLSAYGVHGREVNKEDAKSGLDQTMATIRIVLSQTRRN